VNELHLHVASVREHPEDKTSALALVDHFQEEGTPTRGEALRKVAAIRATKRRAHELAVATALMSNDTPTRTVLYLMMLHSLSLDLTIPATVCVVEGRRAPVVELRHDEAGDHVWTEYEITVGAGWLLNSERVIAPNINPPILLPAGEWPNE